MTPEDVRAELERILAAEPFANAGRLSRLLRYLVERTLAGQGDQLKEYTLGVDVFDRSGSYDPRLDSIVRVEARRLRSKLEEYYQGPGATDPLVITIPRGNYAAVFAAAATAAASAPGTPHSAPAHSTPHTELRTFTDARLRWLAILAVTASVLIVVLFITARSRPVVTPTAQASGSPSIAVLPFQHFSTNEAHAMLAAQITDGVTTDLAKLGTVAVTSRTSASQYTNPIRPVREIADALKVDFVMEASAVAQSGGVHIEARIVDPVLDRKVWVGAYDSSADGIPELTKRIATETSAAILRISTQP